MGQAKQPPRVKLICAMLAGRNEWLDRAEGLLEARFGPIDLTSQTWPFDATDYYEEEMGPGLLRRIHSFCELVDPAGIVEAKLATNHMEQRLAAKLTDGPARPVNLDMGYVDGGKLVLATTKDYAHRLYLGAGIYGEVTLRWRAGAFEPWEWTYPDYRSGHYREFFAQVRAACLAERRRGRRP